MALQHPIEELLADAASNAKEILSWCCRSTGVVPPTPARAAAIAVLRNTQLSEPTLRCLGGAWGPISGMEALVYEIEHIAVPHIDYWHRERSSSVAAALGR